MSKTPINSPVINPYSLKEKILVWILNTFYRDYSVIKHVVSYKKPEGTVLALREKTIYVESATYADFVHCSDEGLNQHRLAFFNEIQTELIPAIEKASHEFAKEAILRGIPLNKRPL